MRSTSRAYQTKREYTAQEAVYLLMPESWLRKSFPGVVFANSNLPENRYRICHSKKEIDELPEDNCVVFKLNKIDRYIDRPNAFFLGGKYKMLETFCYSNFLAHYYILPNTDTVNDSLPTILQEDLL